MAPHETTNSTSNEDYTLDDVMLSICSIDNRSARYDVLLSSVSTLIDKLDGVVNKINELECSFIELKRKNVSLNDTVNTLSQRIKLLEEKQKALVSPTLTALNDIKRHSQHTNTQQNNNNFKKSEIVISGFQESNDLNEPMQIVAAVLDVQVNPAEIFNARFMRKKFNDSIPDNGTSLSSTSPARDRVSIAVECSNYSVVNKIIAAKKKTGSLNFSMLDKRLLSHEIVNFLSKREFNINVNKLLPANTFKLLGKTKKILKSVSTKYVWSSNGIVRAEINDHSIIYNISGPEDIKKLVICSCLSKHLIVLTSTYS